jgi:hypothetical protein
MTNGTNDGGPVGTIGNAEQIFEAEEILSLTPTDKTGQ